MQAVEAYYNEGTFVPLKPITIPKGSRAIVTILDFPLREAARGSAGYLLEPNPNKKPIPGRLINDIKIPEDFKEPLEEMMEYMY
jgi:predicted DNA-binding antitoxin AbrB/MazE fold protein